MKRIAVFALLIGLFAACGKPASTGVNLKTSFDPSENCQIGKLCVSPSAAPEGNQGAIGEPESPKPVQSVAPAETVAVTVVIPEGANYEPAEVELSIGQILEVINKDCRTDIPGRSYTAVDGTFDSGLLGCGKVFRWKADATGSFQLKDDSGFPVTGKVTVAA